MNIDTKVYRKHESPTFGNTLLGAAPLVSEVYLIDNIQLMKHYPDKYFDLAVVDPPYGLDVANMRMGVGVGKRCSKEKNRNWKAKDWDKEPPNEMYFNELFRVSKNQIIFGANNFTLPNSKYFAIWDKGEGLYGRSFAECEYAWVREGGTRIFKISPVQKDRFHPTQKPIELYDKVFNLYAKQEMKILDTHLGSGSSRISANKAKLHFVGCEIDEEYFNKQNKRYEEFVSQARLF